MGTGACMHVIRSAGACDDECSTCIHATMSACACMDAMMSAGVFLNNSAFATTLHWPFLSFRNMVDFSAAYNHNPRYFFGSLIVFAVTSEVKPLEKEMYET